MGRTNTQALNILIISDVNSKSLTHICRSEYVKKLYSNFHSDFSIEIKFNTFRELALKCKSLKIDLVIVEDTKFILQGIADVLRKNFINCISLNSHWTQLVLSNKFRREMMSKYEINVPETLNYPKTFPLLFKADGFSEIVYSLEDVIKLRNNFQKLSPELEKTIYLEEYIDGEHFLFNSFFDGKNLIGYSENPLVLDYQQKLQEMFRKENSNFLGFVTSELILTADKGYNIGFKLDFPSLNPETNFIYLAISGIYQKLNEIKLTKPL